MYEPTVWLQPGSRPLYFFGLPASLARFYGYGFDAGLDWPSSLYPPKPTPTTAFYPFSRPSVLAPDRIDLRAAARALPFTPHTARFIVLDVRGHTVVISIATEARSVEKPPYPDVLEAIRPTLNTIRFT